MDAQKRSSERQQECTEFFASMLQKSDELYECVRKLSDLSLAISRQVRPYTALLDKLTGYNKSRGIVLAPKDQDSLQMVWPMDCDWIYTEPKSGSPCAGMVIKFKPWDDPANAEGNRVRKYVWGLSTTGNGDSNSEGTGSMVTGGNHHRETGSAFNDKLMVLFDTEAQAHGTGNFSLFSKITMTRQQIVFVTASGQEMDTFMSGPVSFEQFELGDVHYCPDLGNKLIVSGSVMDKLGYSFESGGGKFRVKDDRTGRIVGEGHILDDHFILDYLKILDDRASRSEGAALMAWNAACSVLRRLGQSMIPQGANTLNRVPVSASEGEGLVWSLWNAASSRWNTITGRLPSPSARRPAV